MSLWLFVTSGNINNVLKQDFLNWLCTCACMCTFLMHASLTLLLVLTTSTIASFVAQVGEHASFKLTLCHHTHHFDLSHSDAYKKQCIQDTLSDWSDLQHSVLWNTNCLAAVEHMQPGEEPGRLWFSLEHLMCQHHIYHKLLNGNMPQPASKNCYCHSATETNQHKQAQIYTWFSNTVTLGWLVWVKA